MNTGEMVKTNREIVGYAGTHRKVAPAGTLVKVAYIGDLVRVTWGQNRGRISARIPASYLTTN